MVGLRLSQRPSVRRLPHDWYTGASSRRTEGPSGVPEMQNRVQRFSVSREKLDGPLRRADKAKAWRSFKSALGAIPAKQKRPTPFGLSAISTGLARRSRIRRTFTLFYDLLWLHPSAATKIGFGCSQLSG